jgi:hypothetical protein
VDYLENYHSTMILSLLVLELLNVLLLALPASRFRRWCLLPLVLLGHVHALIIGDRGDPTNFQLAPSISGSMALIVADVAYSDRKAVMRLRVDDSTPEKRSALAREGKGPVWGVPVAEYPFLKRVVWVWHSFKWNPRCVGTNQEVQNVPVIPEDWRNKGGRTRFLKYRLKHLLSGLTSTHFATILRMLMLSLSCIYYCRFLASIQELYKSWRLSSAIVQSCTT